MSPHLHRKCLAQCLVRIWVVSYKQGTTTLWHEFPWMPTKNINCSFAEKTRCGRSIEGKVMSKGYPSFPWTCLPLPMYAVLGFTSTQNLTTLPHCYYCCWSKPTSPLTWRLARASSLVSPFYPSQGTACSPHSTRAVPLWCRSVEVTHQVRRFHGSFSHAGKSQHPFKSLLSSK